MNLDTASGADVYSALVSINLTTALPVWTLISWLIIMWLIVRVRRLENRLSALLRGLHPKPTDQDGDPHAPPRS
jgi:uncharacterized membrane protein